MENNISIGSTVTWGSGAPLAEVTLITGGSARVQLIQDLKGPCGRGFLKGMAVTMPISELRLLG